MLSSSIYHAKFSLASIYNYRRGFLLRRQRPGAFNLDGTAREQETRANTRKINLRAGGRAVGLAWKKLNGTRQPEPDVGKIPRTAFALLNYQSRS